MEIHYEHCGAGYNRPNYGCYIYYNSQTCSCDCPGCNPDNPICETCYEGKHEKCEDKESCECISEAKISIESAQKVIDMHKPLVKQRMEDKQKLRIA